MDMIPLSYRPIDRLCPSLLPERVVHVYEVACDQHAVYIRYTLLPPLSPLDVEAGEKPGVLWLFHGKDNLSTSSTQWFDASRTTADGRTTEGHPSTITTSSSDLADDCFVSLDRVSLGFWRMSFCC